MPILSTSQIQEVRQFAEIHLTKPILDAWPVRLPGGAVRRFRREADPRLVNAEPLWPMAQVLERKEYRAHIGYGLAVSWFREKWESGPRPHVIAPSQASPPAKRCRRNWAAHGAAA